MNIVITMAGTGSRFRKAGYDIPKYMIKAHNKTLFEWSLISLLNLNNNNTTYFFIVRKEDNAKGFIENEIKKLNIKNFNIIEINELTDGQATTAMLVSNRWNKNDELLIYNIDTYVEKNQIKLEQLKGDGVIPCFKALGNHWSFVKLDEDGKAIEVKEKIRISDNCTIGAYYFKTAKLYEELYNEYYLNNNDYATMEKYIAPLYNYLIQKGGEVSITIIPTEKVHVLGTPEELKEFIENYNLI